MSKTLVKSSQMSLLDIIPSKPLTHGELAVLRGEMTQEQLNEINRAGLEAEKFFNNYFDRNK